MICLVLIPSTLAYSELAGATPVSGIFAALAGIGVYFLFATSRHMNVGPDGAVALLAGSIVIPLVADGAGDAVVLGVWLAIFTGIILVVAGLLQLGAIADFLSAPVLLGYLNGAAVVIVLSQWDNLFGVPIGESSLLLGVAEWVRRIDETHLPTLVTGLATLALLILAKRVTRRVPPLVPVFFLALAAGALYDFSSVGIAVIGAIRDTSLHTVDLFDIPLDSLARLFVGALGLAILIFPEGILLGRAMADRHGYEVDPDRELRALGLCNVASGAFMGFGIGGSQTRTLLNSAAGGRTQMANLVAGALLVGFTLFALQWIETLPKVAIAAILVYAGINMVDVQGMRRIHRLHRPTAMIALGTTFAVVAIGVLPGILLGTALSIGTLLADLARPEDALLGRVEGSPYLEDMGDDSRAVGIPGLVVYRFYGPLMFANIGYFEARIRHFIQRSEAPVRRVLIDARAIPYIDLSAADRLRETIRRLGDQGIEVALATTELPLRESAGRFGTEDLVPNELRHRDLPEGIAAFEARWGAEHAPGREPAGSP